MGWRTFGIRKHFNPRSREGSDKIVFYKDTNTLISIRAPARGATVYRLFKCLLIEFQSALPRGERLCMGLVGEGGFQNFNPRSREGSD